MPTIEVFADVACPFAYVTLRRLADRRAALGRSDVRIRVRAWPIEWINDKPHDPARKAAEVEALRESVAPDLFVGFTPEGFPRSSVPHLALERAALVAGDDQGLAAALEVRHLCFEPTATRDASLAGIAARVGLDPAVVDDRSGVEADWREGRQRGVRGSPHCFVGDREWFCPLFGVDEVDGRFRVTADPARAADFLVAAFAS